MGAPATVAHRVQAMVAAAMAARRVRMTDAEPTRAIAMDARLVRRACHKVVRCRRVAARARRQFRQDARRRRLKIIVATAVRVVAAADVARAAPARPAAIRAIGPLAAVIRAIGPMVAELGAARVAAFAARRVAAVVALKADAARLSRWLVLAAQLRAQLRAARPNRKTWTTARSPLADATVAMRAKVNIAVVVPIVDLSVSRKSWKRFR